MRIKRLKKRKTRTRVNNKERNKQKKLNKRKRNKEVIKKEMLIPVKLFKLKFKLPRLLNKQLVHHLD